jgi:hypothetical protein
VRQPCQASLVHCSVSGTWWLDIDAAEAATPRVFVKQPLEIELLGSDPDISATATLSVWVESK